jgi:hypothetical protein
LQPFRGWLPFFLISTCLFSISFGTDRIKLDFREETLTVTLEDESLKNILGRIQKETGIWFKAPEYLLSEKMSIRFDNLPIRESLKRILRTMNYSTVYDRNNNLLGVFIVGKADTRSKAGYLADLNE